MRLVAVLPAYLHLEYRNCFIGKKIGFGGTCVVHEVTLDPSAELPEPVAAVAKECPRMVIKIFTSSAPDSMQSLHQEISILYGFRNFAVSQLIAFCNEPKSFILKYYESNLEKEILNSLSFVRNREAKLAISRDIATLLSRMHLEGIAHMDIKPENILIDGNRAVLSDFGGCVIYNHTKVTGRPKLDRFGITFEYAPWEVLSAPCWDDFSPPAVDVYAFGVVMFHLFMDHMPRRSRTKEQTIAFGKSGGFYAHVQSLMPNGGVKNLVLQCIAVDRMHRPRMSEVVNFLRAIKP